MLATFSSRSKIFLGANCWRLLISAICIFLVGEVFTSLIGGFMVPFGKVMTTRRMVIVGASLSASTLFAPYSHSEEPLPSTTIPNIASLPRELVKIITNRYFAPNWNQAFVASFPKQISLDSSVPGQVLEVKWDPRLFSLHDPAFVIIQGNVQETAIERVSEGSANVTLWDNSTEVVLRVVPNDLYPSENIESVRPVELVLKNSDETYVRTWTDEAVGVECTAWGLEASVSWISHQGRVVPALTSLVSVGPEPAPAGIIANLQYSDIADVPKLLDATKGEMLLTDGRNDSDVGYVESSADKSQTMDSTNFVSIETSTNEGVRDVIIKTLVAIEVGKRIELVSSVQLSDSVPAEFSTVVPRLVIQPTPDIIGRRQSGRECIYPVTGAGSQESTYIAAPSA